MAGNWTTLELPVGAKPVHNKVGTFLLLSPSEKDKYSTWKAYQRHDGSFWFYFGSGIKRKADDIVPGYQVLLLKY